MFQINLEIIVEERGIKRLVLLIDLLKKLSPTIDCELLESR